MYKIKMCLIESSFLWRKDFIERRETSLRSDMLMSPVMFWPSMMIITWSCGSTFGIFWFVLEKRRRALLARWSQLTLSCDIRGNYEYITESSWCPRTCWKSTLIGKRCRTILILRRISRCLNLSGTLRLVKDARYTPFSWSHPILRYPCVIW